MNESTIHLSRADGVAVLTMSRPHCLDIEGKHAILEAVRSLAEEAELRAVILAASHPRAWLVNVTELVEMTADQAREFSRAGHQLADALEDLPVPVIGAVDGPALGGGCELVLACDFAFAGENAQFGQIEAMGGVLPAFGGTWRLARRVGHQRALRMLLTAEIIGAKAAQEFGLVMEVVPADQLLSRCRDLAVRITKVSQQSVTAIKRVVKSGAHLAPDAVSAMEEEVFASLFGTDDQRGRMRAFLAAETGSSQRS